MEIRPIGIASARAWCDRVHSHHRAPLGGLFALAVWVDDRCVCVAVVSRPVARALDDGRTAEVTRVASDGSTRGAASAVLRACVRACAERGLDRVTSYTLAGEVGASYRAARWRPTAIVRGGEWSRSARARAPVDQRGDKIRWEAGERAAPRSMAAMELLARSLGTALVTRVPAQQEFDL